MYSALSKELKMEKWKIYLKKFKSRKSKKKRNLCRLSHILLHIYLNQDITAHNASVS